MAVVQDPADAEVREMPTSAIYHAPVDLTLSAQQIGPALVQLASRDLAPRPTTGEDWIDIENRLTAKESDMEDLEKIGKPSSLTCPECGGALWEISLSGPIRYRCHTAHAFTAKVLESLQASTVEDAIWGAVRALHEQERLFIKMSERSQQMGHAISSAEYLAKAEQARKHSQALRALVATRAVIPS